MSIEHEAPVPVEDPAGKRNRRERRAYSAGLASIRRTLTRNALRRKVQRDARATKAAKKALRAQRRVVGSSS